MNQAAGDIIGECGAVAIMNLSTMVTDECEPWMIDAILGFMNNSQSGKVVEHLVVAFWILLRNPRNRLVCTAARLRSFLFCVLVWRELLP